MQEGDIGPEAEPSIEDVLEDQRLRDDYQRGLAYQVYVPSIFESVRPGSEPTLAKRIFAGWEEREGKRHPLFVKEREWQEIRLKEEMDALRAEGFQAPEQWMTLQDIANEIGKNVRTVRRHIVERGECPFTEFGRDKKVRRSDFEEWLGKDKPEARQYRETDEYRNEDF